MKTLCADPIQTTSLPRRLSERQVDCRARALAPLRARSKLCSLFWPGERATDTPCLRVLVFR